MAGARLLL